MNVFDSYKNVIKKAIENDPKTRQRVYGLSGPILEQDQEYIKALRNELPRIELNSDMRYFAKSMGVATSLAYPSLGNHPNFAHLRGTENSEDHWIVSAFIDVKKSTQLFNQFTKATVRLITESIVRASIFAVNVSGGYVHRIQGDGLMVYFGGRNKDKKEAIRNGLKALAMISYFVKNDLKEFFEGNGIKDIHTRAGLDLGHSNQVTWFYSGIGDSGEVTTCSLYTSLVPKMQANAHNNGIVAGHNLYSQIQKDKYFEKRSVAIYTYTDGSEYSQYNFMWEKYLVDIGLAVQNSNGVLVLTTIGLPSPGRNSDDLLTNAVKSKPFFWYE